MVTTTELLKTPQDFIDEETENIKTYLADHNDVQVNKLGIIGFMMNLLGNIRYDSTQYYQKLFIESNASTARDENNLYMHASLYGYSPAMATPSKADGMFSFDFANLSTNSTAVKRTVTFKTVSFKVNGKIFTSDTVYKFVQENQSNYYVIVYLLDGTINHIPSSSSLVSAPFFEVYQKTRQIETILLSNYDSLTYYTHPFTTGDEYLSNISVYIKENGETYTSLYGDEYDVTLIKYLTSSFSKSCFLRMDSANTYKLEFGSGIRGKHIPLATATIIKDITYAESGIINVESVGLPESTCEIVLRTYSTATTFVQNYLSAKLISVQFTDSTQGINPKTGDGLRDEITSHIQTREFLIDKQDYENLTSIDDNEFVYSFKKTAIQRNDFYLYQVLRDENQIPVKSFCVNFPIIDTTKTIQTLISTKLTESDGELTAGDYLYTVYASDGFHISEGVVLRDTLTTENGIELNWDDFTYASTYIISVYDGVSYRDFLTYESTFIDLGQVSDNEVNFAQEEISTDVLPLTYSWQDSYIFFPEFELNSIEFISPFIYKYNSFMNWFEGHLFYDDFIVLFARNNPVTLEINQNYTIPQFHVRVEYDYINKKTRLTVISPQDCSEFTGKISISNTSIQTQQITRLTSNVFYIDYDENYYGILFVEHVIDLIIYNCDSSDVINGPVLTYYTTVEFKQIESLKDQIKIVKYVDEVDETHILTIPVLEKLVYEEKVEDYNLKLLSNITTTNLAEKRFPNDEIQYRFLNTYYIDKKYLRSIIKQTYEFTMYFPLLLTVNIIFDNVYIENTIIDLTTEKNSLYMAIANKLQESYTGHGIIFYNSQMIDFIHNDRPFIKSITIGVTDNNLNDIAYGIEVNDEDTIMENIQDDTFDTDEGNTKTNITYYNPAYFWWDVDNITMNYVFN